MCVIAPSCYAGEPRAVVLLVAVTVNGGSPIEPISVLRLGDGEFLLPEQALVLLRLHLPTSDAVANAGQSFYKVRAIDGGAATLDEATQTLNLTVAASAFVAGSYDEHYVPQQHLDSSATGGFLNYDVFYQNRAPTSLSALLEGGAFFADGTLTSRYIFQDIGDQKDGYRLDTQFVRDFPEVAATLVVGDSISDASAWSRSVYFGGVQWHTNFGTRPDLEALPLPSISGTAAVPSTVDLYVNNVLHGRQTVDAGPFTLANIPAFSGQGNLMVVVRDPLGREQLFVQSYLSSPLLLKPGVIEDGFAFGALREDFGQRDAHYGPAFGSAEYRLGLDGNDTIELHAEQSQGLIAAGAGVSHALGTYGVLTLGGAASHDGSRSGALGYLQFDHQTTSYGLSVRTQLSNASFRELGLGDGETVPKRQTQAQFSYTVATGLSLLTGYTRQANRDTASVQTWNYGLTWSAGRMGSVFLGLLRSFAPSHATSLNAVWTVPLGDQRYVQVAASRNEAVQSASIEYDDSAPAELGWGVRLRHSFDNFAGNDAGVTYRGQSGEYNLSATDTGGRDEVLGEMRGGFAFLGGHVIATKWLDQSFALVTVPTDQPIDIYANGVKVGRTDENGVGFVPNLVAYEPNHIMLDASNLPLQMTVELTTHDVVPRTRSGLVIGFTASRNEGARATLVYPDGQPVETGAEVAIKADTGAEEGRANEKITVALRGDVYFPNLHLPASLLVQSQRGPCAITVDVPANDEEIPNLGVLRCGP